MKTQNISRKNLQIIFKTSGICEKWQKEITNLALFQEGKEIEVEEELIQKAYSEANSEQKGLLNKYFKIENEELFSITTYKEVCKRLKIKELTIKDFVQFEEDALKMFCFHRIKNLERLFNGTWKANWKDKSQYKYYPYFEVNSSGGLGFYGSYYHSYYFNSNPNYTQNTFKNMYRPCLLAKNKMLISHCNSVNLQNKHLNNEDLYRRH